MSQILFLSWDPLACPCGPWILIWEPLAQTAAECHGQEPASWVLKELVGCCACGCVCLKKRKKRSRTVWYMSTLTHTQTHTVSLLLSAEKGTGRLACSNLRQTLSPDHLEVISPAEPVKAQSRSYVYNSVITTGPLELHGWTSHAP